MTETKGIFDPSILADLKNPGYDRSMDIIRASGVVNNQTTPKQSKRLAFSQLKS